MKATIASLYEFDVYLERSYGLYKIPKVAPDGKPGLLVVEDCVEVYDVGADKTSKEIWSGEVIAKDLVVGWVNLGVFVCKGDVPTKAELELAAQKIAETNTRLIFEADKMYDSVVQRSEINDNHRRAARALGVERDWINMQKLTQACPGCGTRVIPGIAKCAACGAILDRDKAIALGIPVPPLPEAPSTPKAKGA